MILKVLIVFDPKLNLFKSDAYIFMQQSHLIAKPNLLLAMPRTMLTDQHWSKLDV